MLFSDRRATAPAGIRQGGRLAIIALAAPAAASVLLMAGAAPAAADRTAPPDTSANGSAFGLAASGAVMVRPAPAAESATAERAYGSLASRTAGPLLSASALSVEAHTRYARASVAGLAALRSALSAEAVTAECVNGRGSVRLVDAALAGRRLVPDPAPNTTIPVYLHRLGAAKVTLNKQVWQPDRRLAVTGLSVSVRLAGNELQTFEIASATCGCVGGSGTSAGGAGKPPAQPPAGPGAAPPAPGADNPGAATPGTGNPGTGAGDPTGSGSAPGTSAEVPSSVTGSGPAAGPRTDVKAGEPVAGPGRPQAGSGVVREASAPTPVRGTLAVAG